MSIFLTGASGTGKTTLGKLIADELGFYQSPSVSRLNPHPMGTKAFQEWTSNMIYNQSMMLTKRVFDRTPFDVVAYDRVFNTGNIILDRMRTKYFADTKPIVLYFPVYWPAEDDGFRPTDVSGPVDECIKEQLDFFNIDYYTVLNESPELRLSHCREFIQERLHENADLQLQE